MNEADVFVLSERALAEVIDRVGDDRWEDVAPGWLQTHGREKPTLRQLVNYHAQDSAWVPDVLAGRTAAEVGTAHDGDLLGGDPARAYRKHSDAAIAAAQALDDPGRTVHLSYGDFPAREYLKHVTSFRGFRAYDLARWIGVDTQLPPDLVQGMWDLLGPEVETWRAIGVYGPAIEVPADAPLQDRLLGLVGRDPHPPVGEAQPTIAR
jgi:uncharacterized protein (TIGR03086 family)